MKINLKNVSLFNWSFGKPLAKEVQPKDLRPATALLAGKSIAFDILVAGAILHACPEIKDREDVFRAARNYANDVAEAAKKKNHDQKIIEQFMLGANDTIDRISAIVDVSDTVSSGE